MHDNELTNQQLQKELQRLKSEYESLKIDFQNDIAEREHAKNALRESEEKYRYIAEQLEAILDHIPGLVFYKDKHNHFIRVNKYVAGTYNKIKVEMHRLTPSDIPNYLTKPYFEDFVTAYRPTFVIRGIFYQEGVAHNFTFLSNVVLNYTTNLNPPVVIGETGVYNFAFEFDPTLLFLDGSGKILVPNYDDNNKQLEKNIKVTMKMKKK